MVDNPAVRDTKQQKQDTSSDENLVHFSLKVLCFAGLAPYEKICNTPRKLKLYRAYQVTLYILFCPLLFSQLVKLYDKSDDLQVAIETITHIVMGVGSYFVPFLINWNEATKMISKTHMSMPTENKIQTDRKKMEILREGERKCKCVSLFILILGEVALFCDLFDIFILHFLEHIAGVEHKYKRNPNAANMYESLLLEKYPFSCWTPFDEKSSMVHIAIYIYTIIPVLAMALKAVAVLSIFTGTMTYVSLQFHFVKKSLEDLSNMEDSDSPIEQKTFSTPEEQHTFEGLNYRNFTVPATYGGSFQSPSQAKLPECWNTDLHRDKTISTANHIKGKEHKKHSDRLHSDNRSLPEDCLLNIIKDHQQAIWTAEEFNKVWSNSAFCLQFALAWLFISGLFQTAMNVDFSTTLKAVLVAAYGFITAGVACYFGEGVKTQSTSITDAAYSVPWYNHSTKFKKMLQMVIMRAQRPCLIFVGPFLPLTLEHFKNVMNASYSYFTLLLQIMKKPASDWVGS